jgi:hypothetical protein
LIQGEQRQAWLEDVVEQLESAALSYDEADVRSLPVNETNGVESRWRRHLLRTGPPQLVQALQALECMVLDTVVEGEGAMDGSVYGTDVLRVRSPVSAPSHAPALCRTKHGLAFSRLIAAGLFRC